MLRSELTEARSEIARHHRDFLRIREILDLHEMTAGARTTLADDRLQDIRNIVG